VTRHKKRTAGAVLFWKIGAEYSFPTLRKTSKLGNSLQLTGFPPSQHVLFSNKNIKIKPCKAKHSGKKDFIFSLIVVNQLLKPTVFCCHAERSEASGL